ncbi:MAG: hypothetical protein K2Q01_04175, partial [Rickettsiales bacterium]|nr:hypothetical protein [Rickettsiales bacterium]
MECSPVREEAFQDIASRSAIIRVVVAVFARLQRLGIGHWLVVLYGLLYFLRARLPEKPEVLGIGFYSNELKQLDDFERISGVALSRVEWRLLHVQGVLAL